jgi:hypothetical protein
VLKGGHHCESVRAKERGRGTGVREGGNHGGFSGGIDVVPSLFSLFDWRDREKDIEPGGQRTGRGYPEEGRAWEQSLTKIG